MTREKNFWYWNQVATRSTWARVHGPGDDSKKRLTNWLAPWNKFFPVPIASWAWVATPLRFEPHLSKRWWNDRHRICHETRCQTKMNHFKPCSCPNATFNNVNKETKSSQPVVSPEGSFIQLRDYECDIHVSSNGNHVTNLQFIRKLWSVQLWTWEKLDNAIECSRMNMGRPSYSLTAALIWLSPPLQEIIKYPLFL